MDRTMTPEQMEELESVNAQLFAIFAYASYKTPVVAMMKIIYHMKESGEYVPWIMEAWRAASEEYSQ
jgi:hypothetical protein